MPFDVSPVKQLLNNLIFKCFEELASFFNTHSAHAPFVYKERRRRALNMPVNLKNQTTEKGLIFKEIPGGDISLV